MPLTPAAPFLSVPFIARDIEVERRPDGVLVFRNRTPLRDTERHIPALLRRQAAQHPDRTWLAQRRGPEFAWHCVSYQEARLQVDAVTQALLDLDAPGRPVMVLSENSIEHGLLALAAMQARMPVAPVTPAYSLLSDDHAKLKAMANLLDPAVVFVQSGRRFERALRALDLSRARVLYVEDPLPDLQGLLWQGVVVTPVRSDVEVSIAAITPDTVAKYLFTSGSTGTPKAVITTQRMLCASHAMLAQLVEEPPEAPPAVVLDWLPWSHVMGGSAEFHRILGEGGALYIDDGKPTPGKFEQTLFNLREISPTRFANVPIGFAMLADALERDEALARTFFRSLRALSYGGARLPDDIHARLQALAARHTGHRIPFVSGYGATETAPSATFVFWATERVGLIGLPHPGVELKLLPLDATRYEVRVRSAAVMPGYLAQPELSAQAFDEEGFYKMGDAASFVDPQDPREGLVFAGRVSEEFKLQSGVYVRVGSLRIQAIDAAQSLLTDVVVAGADRSYIGLLAWPNLAACRALLGRPEATAAEIVRSPRLSEALQKAFARHNLAHPGSSTQIHRLLLLTEPPSMDAGEVTDKGYINQRKVLERRLDEVIRLYAEPLEEAVIRIE